MMAATRKKNEGSVNEVDDSVDVKISAFADLAVEAWRLQRWAFMSGFEKERGIARHTARKLGSFLTEMEFELCDLTGQPYDPGLAVEVIDTEHRADSPVDTPRIAEQVLHQLRARCISMIAPIVLWADG
jgi:hypothetical protein